MAGRRAFAGFLLAGACVALLVSVNAATTTHYPTPSTQTLTLTPFATLPLQLSAGPDGATISSSSTSSSASITATAGGLVDKFTNNTILTNPNAQTIQARLVYRSITPTNLADCTTCKLQLRQGATVSDQITITGGSAPPAGTAGPWVTIQPSGQVGSIWYIWADAKATIPAQSEVMSFWLEIAMNDADASPKAEYRLMQMTFVV